MRETERKINVAEDILIAIESVLPHKSNRIQTDAVRIALVAAEMRWYHKYKPPVFWRRWWEIIRP